MQQHKIIILGPAHPYRGGIAKGNELLANEFRKQGIDCKVITFTLQYPKILFPGKTQYTTDELAYPIKIERKINSVNPFNWLSVGWAIRKEAPTLLIIRHWLPFMGPNMGTIARIAKGNKRTKVIAFFDNLIPHEKRIGDTLFNKYFVSSADAFLAMSNSVLNDLKQFNTEKPRVFSPHPVFDNYGEKLTKKAACEWLNVEEELQYILFFGFVREYKGLDLLLEAFAKLTKVQPNVRLMVVGEYYSDEEKYQKIMQDLGIQDLIIQRKEFVPDEEIRYYFSAADLVAQPYKTATQSGVTQIGYHFEKPMLVTNVGGLAEIIPHGKVGYVVDSNPQSIFEGLNDFFEVDRAAEFSENLKKEKVRFSWQKMTENLLELHQKTNK
jgi:glycosyltransferase involved in cell wall biosynthesis